MFPVWGCFSQIPWSEETKRGECVVWAVRGFGILFCISGWLHPTCPPSIPDWHRGCFRDVIWGKGWIWTCYSHQGRTEREKLTSSVIEVYARRDITWFPVNHDPFWGMSAVQNLLLGGANSVREELKLWNLKSLAVSEPWSCAQDLRSQVLLRSRLWHRGFCSGGPRWWIWAWKRNHNIFTPWVHRMGCVCGGVLFGATCIKAWFMLAPQRIYPPFIPSEEKSGNFITAGKQWGGKTFSF